MDLLILATFVVALLSSILSGMSGGVAEGLLWRRFSF